jgi:hypothetical protein
LKLKILTDMKIRFKKNQTFSQSAQLVTPGTQTCATELKKLTIIIFSTSYSTLNKFLLFQNFDDNFQRNHNRIEDISVHPLPMRENSIKYFTP